LGEPDFSIFRLYLGDKDGHGRFLQNTNYDLPDYTAITSQKIVILRRKEVAH
jgi:hypothetical protein